MTAYAVILANSCLNGYAYYIINSLQHDCIQSNTGLLMCHWLNTLYTITLSGKTPHISRLTSSRFICEARGARGPAAAIK